MSERSVTIWNLLVLFTIISLVASSFSVFPMNKKYNRVKKRSTDLQFGTDKELENIISYLEGRLEERSQFQFERPGRRDPPLTAGGGDGLGRRWYGA